MNYHYNFSVTDGKKSDADAYYLELKEIEHVANYATYYGKSYAYDAWAKVSIGEWRWAGTLGELLRFCEVTLDRAD